MAAQKTVFKPIKPAEPITTQDNFRLDYALALNWYNYYWDEADYLKSALAYAKYADMKDCIPAIRKALPKEIRAIAVLGRLMVRDQFVDGDRLESAHTRMNELKQKYSSTQTVLELSTSPKVVSIQDRLNDIALNYKNEIDEEIDKFIDNKYTSDFSMANFLKAKQVNNITSKKIAGLFAAEIEEINTVLKGTDPELNEGYNTTSTYRLKKYLAFLGMIVEDCAKHAVVVKTQRAPRVKKAKSPMKLTENMKYLKEFTDLKLSSIAASKIIGSAELWCYNTENRKLFVYKAADRDGLGVSGMSVTFFNPETTVAKTIRDPEKFFNALTVSKRGLDNAWKLIKAKPSKPRARITETTILLFAA